jgi:histone deacetylase complex subunit SAP18
MTTIATPETAQDSPFPMEMDASNDDRHERQFRQATEHPATDTNGQTRAFSTRPAPAAARIDRQTTCPFMVKMYCRINGHHRAEEYAPPRFPVDDELIVYTWRDATLRELSLLVREVLGEQETHAHAHTHAHNSMADASNSANKTDKDLKFSFKLVYPDPRRKGRFVFRDLGWAFEGGSSNGSPRSQAAGPSDSSSRTLQSLGFHPGDFIDVAIFNNPAMIPRPDPSAVGANRRNNPGGRR